MNPIHVLSLSLWESANKTRIAVEMWRITLYIYNAVRDTSGNPTLGMTPIGGLPRIGDC